MRKLAAPVAALFMLTNIAVAKPPENANPAFTEYFKSLVTKEGWGCCDIADCREVRMENRSDGPWVFIDKENFGSTAPDTWIKVPTSAYGTKNASEKAPQRPAGAVACWYNGGIRCFDWPLPEI